VSPCFVYFAGEGYNVFDYKCIQKSIDVAMKDLLSKAFFVLNELTGLLFTNLYVLFTIIE
ncbi:MAG: hypothetical protein LM588_07225, partial [Fervidicoccaceae archaeon]|nr:hypothetical protein [Fervidicoccaceae archaeon]